ncbi:MAG: HpcH/HpaI aldolase [Solirubrobacterales bacterium]|nr:HpcH/HpaI aldolase [Solirubrobacterales bacterium]
MPSNPILARWGRSEAALDCWATGASAATVEALGRLDCDAVVIDMQHSACELRDVAAAIVALESTGTAAVVRVPALDGATVQRVLDAGALGVMCPMVNTAAEAEQLASACRYPPRGTRSFGPWRPADGAADYYREADDAIVAIAQIETLDALDRAEEIAAVPGIDALYAGTADLAISAGEDPFGFGPEARDRLARMAAAAHAAGKRAGMLAPTAATLEVAADCGMDLVSVALESWLVVAGATDALARGRATLQAVRA